MDLFDKLKSEPAVEKIRKSKSTNDEIKPVSRETTPLVVIEPVEEEDIIEDKEKSPSLSSPLKLDKSLVLSPPPKLDKLLSLSPPPTLDKSLSLSPPLKLDKSLSLSPIPEINTKKSPNKQVRVSKERTKVPINAAQEQSLLNKPVKNITPTKAQQKQFDPAVLRKAQELQKFRMRSCFVRVKRANLKKLQNKFEKKSKPAKKTINKPQTTKRAHTATTAETSSPPAKKSKPDKKLKSAFFVKITSPTTRKSIDKTSPPSVRSERNEWPKSKSSAKTSKLSVKPTKFTRTQLIEKFGKKYFSAVVKIERCDHPLMVAFDSEAREQRSKRNKSKNLSVSFHKEVEILDQSPKRRGSKKSPKKSNETPAMPLVPARLQKIENGKVVNEIELDQSMFLNTTGDNLVSSTPIVLSKAKKRGRPNSGHIVPLKDENMQSPAHKNFKLANEKMPSLNIMECDDDDEEVEFIVPEVDIPEKLKTGFYSNAKSNSLAKLAEECLNNEGKRGKPKNEISTSITKTISAQSTPAKLAPAKSTPAKLAPAKSTPAKLPPAKSTPAKLAPAKSTPAKSTPTKATPAKATKAKVTPAKVIPAKVTPAKSTPAKSTTPKSTRSKTTPTITTPTKTEPTKKDPIKSTPTKTTSTKAIPTKSTPIKATPTKTPTSKSKQRKESVSKSTPSKTTNTAESTPLSSSEEEKVVDDEKTNQNADNLNQIKETDIGMTEINPTSTITTITTTNNETKPSGAAIDETSIITTNSSPKPHSENANSSGDSFLSAVAEIIENSSEKNKENTENNSGLENSRNRVETETISESSNASTDVQINTSKTTTTTTTPTTCTEKTPKSTVKKSLKESFANEKSNDMFDTGDTKKQLSFDDDASDDLEQQMKPTTNRSVESTPNKSFSSETLNAVEAALKTYTQSLIARSNDIEDDIEAVAAELDLPINLLTEDIETTSDAGDKVDNIITELSKDIEPEAAEQQ